MNFRNNQIHLVIIIIFSMIALVWLCSESKYLLFMDGVSKVEITVNSDIAHKDSDTVFGGKE